MFGVPDHFWSDMLCVFLFGLLLIVLVGFGLKVIDFIWKKLNLEEQVEKGNIAAGIVMGSCVIGLCHALATVVKSITGG